MQTNDQNNDTTPDEVVVPSSDAYTEPAAADPSISAEVNSAAEAPKPFGDSLNVANIPETAALTAQPGIPTESTGLPQKKNIFIEKKRLLIGIAIGFVILATGASVALGYFTVTKSDYRAAYTTQQALIDNYQSTTALTTSLSATMSKGSSTELAKSMNEKVATLKSDIKKLGDTKAIRVDSELQSAYKNLTDKLPLFDEAFALTAESLEKVYPALSAYSSTSLSDTYEAKTTVVITAFESVDGLKYEVNKTLIQSVKAAFQEALPYAKKMDAYKADYKKYEAGVSTSYFAALKKYTDALKEWQTKVKEVTQKGEIKNEVNSLSSLLSKKAN